MLVNLGLGLLGVKVKDTCHFAHIIFLSLSLNVQPVNSFVLIITWFVWVCGNAPSNKYIMNGVGAVDSMTIILGDISM